MEGVSFHYTDVGSSLAIVKKALRLIPGLAAGAMFLSAFNGQLGFVPKNVSRRFQMKTYDAIYQVWVGI